MREDAPMIPIDAGFGHSTRQHVDETDLQLLHALQLDPRAAWIDVGALLGIDPGTAARRWKRLEDDGTAWLTVAPGPRHARDGLVGAAVEIECEPKATDEIARAVAARPSCLTVEHVSGGADLLVEVVAGSRAAVTELVQAGIRALPGVRATRTSLATALWREGASWRLDALSPDQQSRLSPGPPGVDGPQPPPRAAELGALLAALDGEVRMPLNRLAQRLGTSPLTARRRLERSVASEALRLRCDFAQEAVGYPVTLNSWYDVPPQHLEQIGPEVARMPTVRLCAGITGGTANLLVGHWLRSHHAAAAVEADVARRLPELRLVQRSLVLRTVKRSGRLLDA
jgi:DNA-binding Lrp family transcriptional regulator